MNSGLKMMTGTVKMMSIRASIDASIDAWNELVGKYRAAQDITAKYNEKLRALLEEYQAELKEAYGEYVYADSSTFTPVFMVDTPTAAEYADKTVYSSENAPIADYRYDLNTPIIERVIVL